MQSIPLKQSTADIDLISPLGKWIDERGGNVGFTRNDGAKHRSMQSEDADDHLATFVRMRMHAVSVRAATNVGQKVVRMQGLVLGLSLVVALVFICVVF